MRTNTHQPQIPEYKAGATSRDIFALRPGGKLSLCLILLGAILSGRLDGAEKKSKDGMHCEWVVKEGATKTECWAELTITNQTGRTLSFIQRGPLPYCNLTMTDASGKPCPYTETGLVMLELENRHIFSTKEVHLKHGESKTWKARMHGYFQLAPGTWNLEIVTGVPIPNASSTRRGEIIKLTEKVELR